MIEISQDYDRLLTILKLNKPLGAGARALLGLRDGSEMSSDQMAEIASKGLKDPDMLSRSEIRSICALVLTQASSQNR